MKKGIPKQIRNDIKKEIIMENIHFVEHKKWYLGISGVILGVGLLFIVLFGLKFSIEFTGGSELELRIKSQELRSNKNQIKQIVEKQGVQVVSIKDSSNNITTIRTNPITQKQDKQIIAALQKKYSGIEQIGFETVGPTIGSETEANAIKAVLIASFAIMAYIAFAFRQVSKPVASWKFGVSAIAALFHDVFVTIGIFAILGEFFGVEIGPLFITALLTVMGFSVHDTIVVFDRIRENIKKNTNHSFDEVVNDSLMETLARSLRTSLTVVLVLVALLLFGSPSIFWFIVALLIGIISGTYSSIFTASQLLAVWNDWDKKRSKKK